MRKCARAVRSSYSRITSIWVDQCVSFDRIGQHTNTYPRIHMAGIMGLNNISHWFGCLQTTRCIFVSQLCIWCFRNRHKNLHNHSRSDEGNLSRFVSAFDIFGMYFLCNGMWWLLRFSMRWLWPAQTHFKRFCFCFCFVFVIECVRDSLIYSRWDDSNASGCMHSARNRAITKMWK